MHKVAWERLQTSLTFDRKRLPKPELGQFPARILPSPTLSELRRVVKAIHSSGRQLDFKTDPLSYAIFLNSVRVMENMIYCFVNAENAHTPTSKYPRVPRKRNFRRRRCHGTRNQTDRFFDDSLFLSSPPPSDEAKLLGMSSKHFNCTFL